MSSIVKTYNLTFIKKSHPNLKGVNVFFALSDSYPWLAQLLSQVIYPTDIDDIISEVDNVINNQPFENFTVHSTDIIFSNSIVNLTHTTHNQSFDEISLEDFKQVLLEWKAFLVK